MDAKIKEFLKVDIETIEKEVEEIDQRTLLSGLPDENETDWYGYGFSCGNGYANGTGIGSGYRGGYDNVSGYGESGGYGRGSGEPKKINRIIKDGKEFYDLCGTKIHIMSVDEKSNIAKGLVMNMDDFTTRECYIAKVGNSFGYDFSEERAVYWATKKHIDFRKNKM